MRGLARSSHCTTSAATTAIRKPANTPASVKSGTAELRTLQSALSEHGSLSMMDLCVSSRSCGHYDEQSAKRYSRAVVDHTHRIPEPPKESCASTPKIGQGCGPLSGPGRAN